MPRDGPGVILCRAEGAINVGASCRAMKSMGFTRLVLAACPDFDAVEVRTHALSAFDVYEAAERHATLEGALEGFSYAAGFTRRSGRWRKEAIAVDAFAGSPAAASGGGMAIVFGNERDGLRDAELDLCDDAVFIPSSGLFPSLNLSHAVQIACWELRRARLSDASERGEGGLGPTGAKPLSEEAFGGRRPAGRREQLACVDRMTDSLEALGFFKLVGPSDMATFLRGVSARAGLSSAELERLTALFEKIAGLSSARRRSGAAPVAEARLDRPDGR